VYRNLHKRAWSVRVGGKVIAHVAYVELTGCVCRVSAAGLARVRATGVRSVHAYVVGELVASGDGAPRRPPGLTRFTYNPHRADTFHQGDGTPVHAADQMRFDADGAWFA
jgi:hypothetical protein